MTTKQQCVQCGKSWNVSTSAKMWACHDCGDLLQSVTAQKQGSVCLACNRPLEHHRKITAELVKATASATYETPILGFHAPLSPKTIGQWVNHAPLMSTKPITWETPFGVTT